MLEAAVRKEFEYVLELRGEQRLVEELVRMNVQLSREFAISSVLPNRQFSWL